MLAIVPSLIESPMDGTVIVTSFRWEGEVRRPRCCKQKGEEGTACRLNLWRQVAHLTLGLLIEAAHDVTRQAVALKRQCAAHLPGAASSLASPPAELCVGR